MIKSPAAELGFFIPDPESFRLTRPARHPCAPLHVPVIQWLC